MAGVVFQTSFDHYTTMLDRWTSVTGTATNSITSGGRNSTNAWKITSAGGNGRLAAKTLPAPLTTLWFAFAMKGTIIPDATTSFIIAQARDAGTVQCYLRLLSDATIQLCRGPTAAPTVLATTSYSILANTFYHFEWKLVIGNSTGASILKINEVERFNVSSQDTQASANATASEIVLGILPSANQVVGPDYYFDDVVVRDDQESGDVEIGAILPDGAGNYAEWTPLAGSNYQNVDEAAPDGDTTENHTSTVNNRDTFTYQNISTTASVHAVVPLHYAKKTDAGTAKFVSLLRIGGTDYASATEHAPSESSYEYHPTIYMVNPDTGVAFTPTVVNAMEAGYKRTA